MLNRISDWEAYLSAGQENREARQLIQQHTRTGRPLGDPTFISKLETITDKVLAPKRPGRKAAAYDEK